ncbi:MAG: TauD/TfdA family dioxygenase, partial [Acetobacteraceae bacterium]|nr:TauD/TfdA family dioxygenase [Acetobacteraceae bacterium]
MLTIEPSGAILGATVNGLDLRQPLSDADFATVLKALGTHGVLRIPGQSIDARQLRDFSRRFGSIQGSVTGKFHHKEVPEVG